MQVKSGQTILFIGDSITDCGRRGPEAPLGNGYLKLFSDLLMMRHPRMQTSIINKGIGGDTSICLRGRWEDAVLRHRPDWLSIKIGINDLNGHAPILMTAMITDNEVNSPNRRSLSSP